MYFHVVDKGWIEREISRTGEIKLIKDVYPLKAQYISNQLVEIAIEIINKDEAAVEWVLHTRIGFLNEEIEHLINQ